MEAFDSGLPDVFQAVGGVSADVKNQGAASTLMEFLMDLREEVSISVRRAEITAAVVAKRDGITCTPLAARVLATQG
jgi:hypothetical protein